MTDFFRTSFRLPRFESDGSTLFYSVEGEGCSIVFLHPLPFDHRIWTHQVFEFSSRYKVLALDFPGLGLSKQGQGPPTIETLSEDINNMMKAE